VPVSANGERTRLRPVAERRAGDHLERYDPRDLAGKLIDSEHRGRYWWASRAVSGREVLDAGCGLGYGTEILAAAGAAGVTAIDIDEGTVGEARGRYGDLAESFICADLCNLPLADESLDVVVCFETIQHVQDSERALGELHRVLRPGGLLLISSPSPDVYPPGNENHVHEYRPTELSAVVEERFANVERYRQHPWLASSIETVANGSAPRRRETFVTTELDPGAETYSILAGSDAELPDLGDLVTLGRDFEVKWWAEQVAAAERVAAGREAAAEDRAGERIAELEGRLHQAGDRANAAVEEAMALAARESALRRELAGAEAREQAAEALHRDASVALLEANQSLAQLPALQHRYEELEALRTHVEVLEESRSWRYMAPARWLRRVVRLRR
jgi:O-antigen biosynthesis protein